MTIDVRHATHPDWVRGFDTEALRRHFLVEALFVPGQVSLTYSHHDRFVLGGAMPSTAPLQLPVPKALGQPRFLAQRELGVINIGGAGRVRVDGSGYDLARLDCLYIGKSSQELAFESVSADEPAKFYMTSAPAHAVYPTRLIRMADARHQLLGDAATANCRNLYQAIHPEICDSCQLTMGFTLLEAGSVWNTMPCHTHDRRMEAYLYFDLPPEHRVFHYMGAPTETRHLVVASDQAVISPPWSIHSGVGTTNYGFIWAMAGDNKDFTDMDHLAIGELR